MEMNHVHEIESAPALTMYDISFPQTGLQAAPLWDSVRQKFDGMLTLRDVVQLIQHFCVNLSYQQAQEELEIFQIQNLRGVLRTMI